MSLLGVFIPTISAVRIFNKQTGNVTTKSINITQITGKKSSTTNVYQLMFEQLNLKFQVLVIVSTAQNSYSIHSVYQGVSSFAESVYVVPPLMARFMAVIDAIPVDVFKQIQTFAIVTDALGCDQHTFVLNVGKSFNCLNEAFRSSANNVHFKQLGCYPEKIFYTTFKNCPSAVGLSSELQSISQNVVMENFIEMMYVGGIAKAKQINGIWNKIYIKDFAQTMLARIGNEVAFPTKTGNPIPFERVIKKQLGPVKVNLEVHTGTQLTMRKNELRREQDTLQLFNQLSNFQIELTITVNNFGLTTIHLNKPPITVPKAIKSETLKKNTPTWKHTSALAHVFLSTTMIHHELDGTPVESTVGGVAEIEPGTIITCDIVRQHCEQIFTRFSVDLIKPAAFILCHDGTYPAAFIKVAVEVISKFLDPKVTVAYVLCDTIAYLRYGLRQLNHTTINDSKNVLIAIANGTDCLFGFVERSLINGWNITDAFSVAYKSPSDLNYLIKKELEYGQGVSTKLLLTPTAPLSLQTALAKESVRIVRVDNFKRVLIEGLLDFADHMIEDDLANKQRDFVSTVFLKQDDDVSDELFQPITQCLPFEKTITYDVNPNLGGFKIFQQKAAFSKKEHFLLRVDELPPTCTNIKITFNFESFGLTEIRIEPPLKEVVLSVKKPEPLPMFTSDQSTQSMTSSMLNLSLAAQRPLSSVPSSTRTSTASLATSSTMSSTAQTPQEKRSRHLKAMKAEIVITFDVKASTAQIEVLNDDAFTPVTDMNDKLDVPLFISFAEQHPRIGYAALYDYTQKPECIVWDLLLILGRTVPEVVIDDKWTFGIDNASGLLGKAAISIETAAFGKCLIDSNYVFAMFLKAVQKLVEQKTKKIKKNFFFYVPSSTSLQTALKESCKIADLTFAGSNLLKS